MYASQVVHTARGRVYDADTMTEFTVDGMSNNLTLIKRIIDKYERNTPQWNMWVTRYCNVYAHLGRALQLPITF